MSQLIPHRFASLIATLIVGLTSNFGLATIAGAQDAAEAKAPVRRVVLFNSGVGYFEHQGEVDGNATIELKFNVDDVNDLLKSMVVQDLGGGQVSTVTYGSRDPITKTLQTFAIDLTNDPSLGQLLEQIRGERVELDAPTKVTGTIVGLEKQRESVGDDDVVETEYLTLLTEEGLRRISLNSVGRIKLVNAQLDAELRQALAVLAAGHATDKKTVGLKFNGQGERDVLVGYIQETPVWKTSYRLVLNDEGMPLLQGWAIVENTTESDWDDVQLSLVSGRPISFVMDLYSPLYAPRPTVVPELYSSLNPQVYDQDLQQKHFFGQETSAMSEAAVAGEPAAPALADRGLARQQAGGGYGGFGGRPASRFANGVADLSIGLESLQASVQAAAQGGDVGELFQYDIEGDVTLARRRSAMLPIINDEVAGEKLSIYNQQVHQRHPLNGFRLENTSDLHLMQGPVTVFDGGVYAGDARLPDLPPGGERLLSYALDLSLEVAPTGDSRPQQLTQVRIEKGVLISSFKQTRTYAYVVKNSGDQKKRLLVELPIDPAWKLVSPKEPTEKTRSVYRFAVEATPEEPAELKVEQQRTFRQSIAVNNLDDGRIQFFLSAPEVSEEVKTALREIVQRKTALAELNRQAAQTQQEIAAIGEEQERIRRNMQSIDRNTDLYNRYVKKFTEQEDQIEQYRQELRELQEQAAEAQRSLDEYLSELDLA